MVEHKGIMQPSADPHGNARSGIPVPAPSTVQKSQNLRMSMAGPGLLGLRGVGGGTLQAPTPSTTRHSMYRSQNANPLLASASKPNFGRTPLRNSVRRGSIWAGGVQSSDLPSSQPRKDTRPLRDRAFQAKLRQEIVAFLQSTDYEIDKAVLTNITGRDYREIVFHLAAILDPAYLFNDKAKFEDEFLLLLKTLRYPFVAQIDPKWLAAPASMHAWPYLLAVLHWLAEMSKARLHILQSGSPGLLGPSVVPEEFDLEEHHRALAFGYTTEAYEAFLDGADTFEEQDKAFEDRYKAKDAKVMEDLERQKEELDRVTIELQKLESSAPPIKKLKEDNSILKLDMEKFRRILEQYEARRKKLSDGIEHEKEELVIRAEHLEQLKAEQERLQEVVRTQNLTPEEVIKMNTDHEMLQRSLEDLKQKISEAHKTVMSLEVNVTNRAAAAEEAVDAYNNLLSTLSLFPPLPAPWQNVDLTLELNTAAATPTGLLTGADIRKVIRPTLGSIAESKRAQRAEVDSERIKIDDEADQFGLECENVEMDIMELEKKVIALNDQADDLRDAANQEAMVNNAEAARLERELVQARNAALANGMGVKSRLQAVQVQYREQLDKVARLKEDTVRNIVKSSTELGLFKEEVSRHLKQLRDFVESAC